MNYYRIYLGIYPVNYYRSSTISNLEGYVSIHTFPAEKRRIQARSVDAEGLGYGSGCMKMSLSLHYAKRRDASAFQVAPRTGVRRRALTLATQ